MEDTREAEMLPKSQWGAGPWQNEVDESRWIDATTGLRCAVIRSEWAGSLSGYVEITHPALAVQPRSLPYFLVHGGINYSGIRFEMEGDTRWYIGFSTSHLTDYAPHMAALIRRHAGLVDQLVTALTDDGVIRCFYRDLAYVKAECAHLAAQIADAEWTLKTGKR